MCRSHTLCTQALGMRTRGTRAAYHCGTKAAPGPLTRTVSRVYRPRATCGPHRSFLVTDMGIRHPNRGLTSGETARCEDTVQVQRGRGRTSPWGPPTTHSGNSIWTARDRAVRDGWTKGRRVAAQGYSIPLAASFTLVCLSDTASQEPRLQCLLLPPGSPVPFLLCGSVLNWPPDALIPASMHRFHSSQFFFVIIFEILIAIK